MSDKYHEGRVIPHDPKEGFDHTEPEAKSITGFVVASVIALVVVILAISAYFEKIYNEAVYEKVLSVPGQEVGELRQLEEWRLTHYEFVDNKKETVRIPVERAKAPFLKEVGEGKYFYPTKPYAPKKEEPAPAPPEAPPDPNALVQK